MKLGRKFNKGDKIPANTTTILYCHDGYDIRCRAFLRDNIAYTEYELLDLEIPKFPKEPKIGEIWEVLCIPDLERGLRIRKYLGPGVHVTRADNTVPQALPERYEWVRCLYVPYKEEEK